MLAKLNQYKEFISILVFFLGGFFWIDSQYPKKSDLVALLEKVDDNLGRQVKSVACLLGQYMLLTQLQLTAQETEKRIETLTEDLIQSLDSGDNVEVVSLSGAMLIEREEMVDNLGKARDALADIAKNISNVRGELERNICGRISP